MSKALSSIELKGINFFRRGKVREVYDLGDNLLIISTDRVSCFDVILPTPIPEKGRLLTEISKFWFEFTKDIVANHLVSTDVNDYPLELAQY
ncbi:MAG: phosphoribosylaminoimidazolesuccinocarboxamide synthase, partial [Candidatus Omnitrophica bacterium]|nr:phosphoribosylaminoimidazolesuccinocarboxamide synthase [Candidatus Omnitrophota bacterium]